MENRKLRILELHQPGFGNLWMAKVRVTLPQEFGIHGEFFSRVDVGVTFPCDDNQTVETLKTLAVQAASDLIDSGAEFLASAPAEKLITNT